MIDIHCHILPGLDDGPRTLEESVEMCRIAAGDGIRTIAATPHFKPGMFEHPALLVREKIEALADALQAQNIDVRIVPGADICVTPELKQHIGSLDYLTLNKTGKYFLAEFPDVVPPQWEAFLLSFLDQGIIPIITHPERNRWFQDHRPALYSFVSRGGMLQLTAQSITGKFGPEVRTFSEFLLRHDLVHVLASDAHSLVDRPPILSEAIGIARNIIGSEQADALVTTIPEAILAGRKAPVPQPALHIDAPKRKSWIRRLTSL